MHGYLHTKSQLIWESDGVAWPSVLLFQPITFSAVGTVGGLAHDTTNTEPEYWMEIDNTPGPSGINADFCLIEFAGKISAIVTGGTPAGKSTMVGSIVGLPVVGKEVEALPEFATHPVKTISGPIGQLLGSVADALAITGQKLETTPPFFGYIPGVALSANIQDPGFPFHGQPIAVDDPFHFVYPIGKLGDATNSISGYRKLYFLLRSINPLLSGNPTSMSISGKIYAHMYEFRGNAR